jgi:hypothetical protein
VVRSEDGQRTIALFSCLHRSGYDARHHFPTLPWGRVVNRVYPLAKDSPLDSNGFYGEACGIAFHTS